MNKETYFEMVDHKLEMDAQVEKLKEEYQELWWGDDRQAIRKNIRKINILQKKINELSKEMADYREDIPKSILKEWKNDYGQTRGLV